MTTHPVDPGPLELVLHDEEIVVQRRVVPRERVRVDIDVVHEQVDVSDVIRHQRIQVQKLPPASRRKSVIPVCAPLAAWARAARLVELGWPSQGFGACGRHGKSARKVSLIDSWSDDHAGGTFFRSLSACSSRANDRDVRCGTGRRFSWTSR